MRLTFKLRQEQGRPTPNMDFSPGRPPARSGGSSSGESAAKKLKYEDPGPKNKGQGKKSSASSSSRSGGESDPPPLDTQKEKDQKPSYAARQRQIMEKKFDRHAETMDTFTSDFKHMIEVQKKQYELDLQKAKELSIISAAQQEEKRRQEAVAADLQRQREEQQLFQKQQQQTQAMGNFPLLMKKFIDGLDQQSQRELMHSMFGVSLPSSSAATATATTPPKEEKGGEAGDEEEEPEGSAEEADGQTVVKVDDSEEE